ncbi:P-loop containing nucleoside triphosphate hydrolase protein [Rhizopogon vinicolor AM-OR11-026]|uniref:ATP-dependent DNA helicase n=1 Tax=Rhizopogon vinicolor AM-OR11-026 TaxID=1314800 RepID=A0A1B7N2C3_9AGAM|nr:P-loop containing nucleoside triphosphate hydrolase protein [Rhizopogon vinicolor AM-OR11-026]
MSSSDYGSDDELDSHILNELDSLEAAHRDPARHPPNPPPPVKKTPKPLEKEDSFFDLSLDIDEEELQRLDTFIDAAYKGKIPPVAGPSNHARSASSKNTVQTTLFGNIAQPTASSPSKRATSQRTKSSPRNSFGQQAPQTRHWDHTAFAKSGWKKSKSAKGKGRDDDDGDEEEHVEFEQFPAPFVSLGPPPPMKLKVDMLEAKHWIYPLNQPKRDYQFNIVKHCLFDNTLVALPTGLGKTFIAGVVMLNFYRWFPKGKVVFVAPTKPLVAQQIDACHRTCGIPGCDAIELTGNKPRAYRSRMWEEKRVFYMTPQTLVNDLTTENCDPRDIVLMVIDEAHKGTGDYAYAQVIRFLMAKNPHHRVLALTATPGSTPEAIQGIVDSLHISRIEIRDEGSLDLRDYMHKKDIKQHIIKMNGDLLKIQELLKEVMITILKPLTSKGVIDVVDPVKLHPYRAQVIIQRIGAQRNSPHKWAFSSLSRLAALARAMGYLMEASAGMCHKCLLEISAETEDGSGKKKNSTTSSLRKDKNFMAVLSELEVQKVRPGGYGMHPKMETLKMLLLQYFGARMGDGEETRAMVFVTYRDCVDEIVHMLNEESPLLKATRFIGQGTDKQGRKGIAQKEQLEVIKKFKAGEFNVLVSTSIGEEGLDIGEVDMIVCYDAQKTPIRMLQRVGRTGRKRDGYVHVLLSEIREELNWDKAKDTYGELQKCIVRGNQLELYGDVPRLLPEHVKPQLLEKTMEIEEYVREERASRKKTVASDEDSPKKGGKRKRNDDFARNIPQGASTGFVSVRDLLVKAPDTKKRKKAKTKGFDPTAAEDDSTDMELESNLMDMHRTASTPADVSTKKKKDNLRKARTMDTSKQGKPTTSRKKGKEKETAPTTASQFLRKGDDDDDDIDIEEGISPAAREAIARKTPSPKKKRRTLPRYLSSSSDAPSLAGASHSSAKPSTAGSHLTASGATLPPPTEEPTAENPSSQRLLSSSPVYVMDDVIELSSSPGPELLTESSSISHRPRISPTNKSYAQNGGSRGGSPVRSPSLLSSSSRTGVTQNIAWVLGSDEEPDIQIVSSSPPSPHADNLFDDESIEIVDGRCLSPALAQREAAVEMPPPPLPWRGLESPTPSSDHDMPDSSFAVRPAGRFYKQRPAAMEPESPASEMPPPPRRLKRRDTDLISWGPSPPPKRSKRKPFVSIRHNPLWDGEAAHSGDEASEGSSHSEDDVESESDRQFIKDIATQVSPSYDQSVVYQYGLLTQAPPGGPVFTTRPSRRGAYARESARRRPGVSSSPAREDDSPDEYAIGSFIVDDDEDII